MRKIPLWVPGSNICCVFGPAFWRCPDPKAGWNTFFSSFQPFFLFEHFSVNFCLKSRKKIWKHLEKMCFKLLCKAGQHANPGWLPKEVHIFSWLQTEIHWKMFKRRKKVETTEKNSYTSFWVHAAPERWSKYTTNIHHYGWLVNLR